MERFDRELADGPAILVVPPLRSARRAAGPQAEPWPPAGHPQNQYQNHQPSSQQQSSQQPLEQLQQLHPADAREAVPVLGDAVGSLLFRTDQHGRLVESNAAFRQLNAQCGGSDHEVAIPGFRAAVDAVLAWGQPVSRSLTATVDGEARHYWTNFVPRRSSTGAVIGVTGAMQEATDQISRVRAAVMDQARYRDFARASSDWFWEIDEYERITALSDRLTALIGKPVALMVGKPFRSLGRLETNLAGDMPFEKAQGSRAPFRNQLMVMEGASGDAVLFHLAGVPVFDDDGHFRGYRGVGMDVTRTYLMEEQSRNAHRNLQDALAELTRKNRALDVASEQARAALEAKNEFLASMSHELRTPLNAIIGFAEAMRMQVFGELQPHYIAYANDIVTAGYHLLGLINDVLDVSVIESGEIALTLEEMALAPLVDQARSLLLLRAESKSIDLDAVRCDPSVRVVADERRTLQILVNLLTNAVKFTPEGGRIGVEVGLRPGARPLVACTVWDTGSGIAPENHERVFEKFQQCVGDTYSGKPEGTGLGLHISRRLARLMGGDIELDSDLGKGARFTVLLPAAGLSG